MKIASVTRPTANTKRPTARWIVSAGMVRPHRLVTSVPRNRDQASIAISAIVVVFSPPAVDPGEPPIDMSRRVAKLLLSAACP